MEFEQVVKRRRMIREFDSDKKIPEKIITKLIRKNWQWNVALAIVMSRLGMLILSPMIRAVPPGFSLTKCTADVVRIITFTALSVVYVDIMLHVHDVI